jgi:hypothetical protein
MTDGVKLNSSKIPLISSILNIEGVHPQKYMQPGLEPGLEMINSRISFFRNHKYLSTKTFSIQEKEAK